MSAVFYREFRAVLRSICGIVFVSGALFALGLFVVLNNFNEGYAGFEANLPALSVAFALLIPLICMDAYPAEEREGTGRFLQILPLSDGEVAMGKYLARLAVAAIPTAAMLFCPVVLDIFGEVNYLQAYGGILMFAVLEVLLISVSMMISAFCRRQLAAWIRLRIFPSLVPCRDPGTAVSDGGVVLAGRISDPVGACRRGHRISFPPGVTRNSHGSRSGSRAGGMLYLVA